jgi:hypothetical protein
VALAVIVVSVIASHLGPGVARNMDLIVMASRVFVRTRPMVMACGLADLGRHPELGGSDHPGVERERERSHQHHAGAEAA